MQTWKYGVIGGTWLVGIGWALAAPTLYFPFGWIGGLVVAIAITAGTLLIPEPPESSTTTQ